MGLLNCDLAEAQRAFFSAPCRDAERRFHALHKFVRFVADGILMNDTDGPTRVPFDPDRLRPKWILPVDAAMLKYGIINEPLFLIPDESGPGGASASKGDSSDFNDPHYVANACHHYLLDLRWTQVYEDLMSRIADEIFYVMFLNRRALANLNEFLARYVGGESVATILIQTKRHWRTFSYVMGS
jgi:hypothetical protein